MKKLLIIILLLFFPALWPGLSYCANTGASTDQLGPENHGLRLGLKITTKRENNKDTHFINITLKNTSKKPIILTTPHQSMHTLLKKNTFNEYLKSIISFPAFPEIPVETAQVEGDKSQIQQKINPGKEIQLEWSSAGSRLKDEYYHNTSCRFPLPGLYSVRAELYVQTSKGKAIHLFSNPQQVSAHGSNKIPKFTVGRITAVFLEENIVEIDLGSSHGIKKDDVFQVKARVKFSYLEIKVISSNRFSSQCKIIGHNKPKKSKKDFFSGRARKVHLVIKK